MTRMLWWILCASSLLTVGCKKENETRTVLPDEIRYHVTFFDAESKNGIDNRVPTLAGASLEVNGRPVATLQRVSASTEVYATWNSPKAGVNALIAREAAGRSKFLWRGRRPAGKG